MKIGLIGYGNIAKKHEAALKHCDFADLQAIYDLNSIDHSHLQTFTKLDDFLNSGLDLISICSPNGFHKADSIKALDSGHHVICEKPFALTTSDCHEMIEAANINGKKIFCTMQNRYSPVSQWLKQLVKQEALGDIYLINVACYWNRNKAYYKQSDWRGKKDTDGGTLFTQFSHYVDTIYWLFGDMNILNANFKNFDHDEMIEFEDTGIFNFTLAKGGMGTFSYTTSCFEKNFESSMTIIGSKGTVKVAGQYMDTVTYCNVKDIQLPELSSNDNLANIGQIYTSAYELISADDSQLSSAHDAMKVVELIEAVYSFK